ncbi:MAG TPA: ADP-ribosylglycohydrolase family protein, partial [Amycolatopsis sp.]|uniref:ADP-ribosylglycohydrolase family protein n=1 Tax=Amycolatopsis sp. TaxID=37632 RepID=UPI002F40B032
MRLTWARPEDLLPHELVQSAAEGKDVTAVRERWIAAGGDPTPVVGGAGPERPSLRQLARELLDELDAPAAAPDWETVLAALPPAPALPVAFRGRELGAWTGRAAGCLLGKPVEKIPREGIEEILRATGRWPLDGWFTAVGLPADVAARWPWNRR